MELKEIIERCQTKVGVASDGKPGVLTWTAIAKALGVDMSEPKSEPVPVFTGERVDERSETAIATLHPNLQPLARQFVMNVAKAGLTVKITSGFRSYKEQDALYEQGRSRPGAIVTGARGGFSSHNFATAFDVTLFDGKNPVWESAHYRKTLAPIGQALGLSWGGTWTKPDEPHYYLKPKWAVNLSEAEMMTELRRRHDAGKDVYA